MPPGPNGVADKAGSCDLMDFDSLPDTWVFFSGKNEPDFGFRISDSGLSRIEILWKVRCPMSGVWCPELSGVRNSQQLCHKPTFSLPSRTYNFPAALIEHICINPFFPLLRGTPPFSFSERIPFLSFPPLTGSRFADTCATLLPNITP